MMTVTSDGPREFCRCNTIDTRERRMSGVNIGHPAPEFEVSTVTAGNPTPRVLGTGDFTGRWLVLFFYPRDFSFVCPTELISFSARVDDFRQRDCELLAVSVDSTARHNEWLATPPEDGGLGPLRYPLASDPEGHLARTFGVWVPEKEVSTRGLFVIDPDGVVQYAVIHNLNVGRNADEVLRVLTALRTGGLCPASWTRADGTLDAEGALQPGRILGHYRIREKLGEGSFGTVFAAWDIRLERMVALKILRRSLGEARQSLLAEARAAAALNHPNLCAIHTVDIEDGLPVIAMEYVDGQTLDRIIRKGLKIETARRLAVRVAAGLAAAHERNVVHGDLKPANIIVSRDGEPKILDFGLARIRAGYLRTRESSGAVKGGPSKPAPTESADPASTLDYHSNLDSTASWGDGGLTGTPAYLSPEQAAGEPGGAAGDVFSLALTIFEMLTGRRALAGDSVVEVVGRLRDEDLADTLAPQLPGEYRPLLAEMLRRTPQQRPTMRQVADRLCAELDRIAL